jgi:hypothetical protein
MTWAASSVRDTCTKCRGQFDAKATVGHSGCGGQVQPRVIASFVAGSGTRKSDGWVSSCRRISVTVRRGFAARNDVSMILRDITPFTPF